MKKLILTTLCCLGALLLAVEPNQLPILGWGWLNWVPGVAEKPEFYREMQECGFTIAGFVSNDAQVAAARAAGMQVIIWHRDIAQVDFRNPAPDAWREKVKAVVDKYADEPAVWGYYVKDEPELADMAGVAAMCQLVRELAPGKEPYANLYPPSANPNHWAPLDYAGYVEKGMREFASKAVGYDQYVFFEDGNVRETMYQGYKVSREQALATGKDWWYCGLAVAHRIYAVPNFAQLNVAAFSALAYGARGLAWFTYLDPGIKGWHDAPINAYGERTATWWALKRVNRDIQGLAPILNHLRSDRVYHFGATVPGSAERLNGPDPESLLAGVLRSDHFLVGEFTHDETGDRYLLVVNKDMLHTNEFLPQWRDGKEPKELNYVFTAHPGELKFGRKPHDNDIFEAGAAALLHLIY